MSRCPRCGVDADNEWLRGGCFWVIMVISVAVGCLGALWLCSG